MWQVDEEDTVQYKLQSILTRRKVNLNQMSRSRDSVISLFYCWTFLFRKLSESTVHHCLEIRLHCGQEWVNQCRYEPARCRLVRDVHPTWVSTLTDWRTSRPVMTNSVGCPNVISSSARGLLANILRPSWTFSIGLHVCRLGWGNSQRCDVKHEGDQGKPGSEKNKAGLPGFKRRKKRMVNKQAWSSQPWRKHV